MRLSRYWSRLAQYMLLAALSVIQPIVACGQKQKIASSVAVSYFAEMKAASEREGSRLWGVSLYGPMMLADEQTRFVVTNQPDKEGKLERDGDVFIGTLPREVPIANTATRWAGVTWTMIGWPLPHSRHDRVQLMAHECFHRIQEHLGMKSVDDGGINNHLEQRDGRIWLQMEFRALERALWSSGAERRRAIGDALAFRAYRQALFSGSSAKENALEFNEGLAEYTGMAVAAKTEEEMTALAEYSLRRGYVLPSFVRSFAYVTGPSYGILLDGSGKPWRNSFPQTRDFARAIANAYDMPFNVPTREGVVARSGKYDGDELIASETDRDPERSKQVAEVRSRLIEGPVLVLPLGTHVRYSFDPNALLPVDENATLYPETQITDEWGVLQVDRDALMFRDWGKLTRVHVSAPSEAGSTQGDGWKLSLKPGWKVVPGARAGDWTVAQVPAS